MYGPGLLLSCSLSARGGSSGLRGGGRGCGQGDVALAERIHTGASTLQRGTERAGLHPNQPLVLLTPESGHLPPVAYGPQGPAQLCPRPPPTAAQAVAAHVLPVSPQGLPRPSPLFGRLFSLTHSWPVCPHTDRLMPTALETTWHCLSCFLVYCLPTAGGRFACFVYCNPKAPYTVVVQ